MSSIAQTPPWITAAHVPISGTISNSGGGGGGSEGFHGSPISNQTLTLKQGTVVISTVRNGFIVKSDEETYVCESLDSLLDTIKRALVSQKLASAR
jgi:hypothetical protein